MTSERRRAGAAVPARLDVVESMGSGLYVCFDTHVGELHSAELDELASDARDDLPAPARSSSPA